MKEKFGMRPNNIHSVRAEEKREHAKLNHQIEFLREDVSQLFKQQEINDEIYMIYKGQVLPNNGCGHLCHLSIAKTIGHDIANPHKTLSYMGRDIIKELFIKAGGQE